MSVTAALWLLVLQPSPNIPADVPGAYKVDGNWAYFRNSSDCFAISQQPSGPQLLTFQYFAAMDAVGIGFTRARSQSPAGDEQRRLDIRFYRAQGVIDDGWEDVAFLRLGFTRDDWLYISQPLELVAARDLAEMDAVEFIERGRRAGYFRMRDPRGAIAEIRRCAKSLGASTSG